ncbi:MAG TPA: hypothetical protein VK927_10915 [Adhaeribacter sp.]|nr:hypothetical protein [Adhaeribacter sp.]
MESIEFYRPANSFLNYLVDSLCKKKQPEQKDELYTIDGDIVSEKAMENAVKKGKGVIIGGFYVGSSLNSDLDCNYSLSI